MAEKKKGILLTGKRLKIDKAQQMTMLEVLVAGVLVGVSVVLSIWLIKYISFNATVIGEKSVAIKEYDESIKNVSVLNENVTAMMSNKDLESVARDALDGCYEIVDGERVKIDFDEKRDEANTAQEKEMYMGMAQTCSALRVIPDALPYKENIEGALSSLNQLYIIAGVVPDTLAPGESANTTTDDGASESESGLQTLTLRTSMESDDEQTFGVLNALERSIREFDVTKLTLEWSGDSSLAVSASIDTYYNGELKAKEKTKTVTAKQGKGK